MGSPTTALSGVSPFQLESRDLDIMDLAQIVIKSRDVEPVTIRIDHAPARQIVQRRTPQHGFFATRIHGDIAANARSFCRGGIDGKDKAGSLGGIRDALGDHTGAGIYRCAFALGAGQEAHLDLAQ